MDQISLELTIQRQEFIQGESIPCKVVLKNISNQNLTLNSFDAKNQSISLVADDKKNESRIGTQMSWKERDGIHIDDPRQYKEFNLAAGEKAEIAADGIEWLGDLPPGEYEMYSAYNSGVNIYTESEPVSFKIIPAKAVYHMSVKSNLKLGYALSKTVWLNQVSNGFDVYLLESSPNFPSNTYRNWKVIHLEKKYEIFPTTANTDPAKFTHLCWLDEKQEMNVISISNDRIPGNLQKHNFNLKDAEILESPFSDASGNLHALVSNNGGKDIIYIRIPAEGMVEKNTLASLKNNLSNYSILWDKDEKLHLAWNGESESAVKYLSFKLNSEFKPPIAKVLCEMSTGISNLELFQTNDPSGELYIEHLYILTGDQQTGKWQRWIVDLPTNEPRIVEILEGVNTFHFTFYQTALTIENEPVYLFKHSNKNIYYCSSDGKNLTPLTGNGSKILTEDSQPILFTTAIFSHKPGVYIRYISTEHDFKYLKME